MPTKIAVEQPVKVKGDPKPIPAEINLTLPPTTTSEQDTNTANQRKINLIWEMTQAFIAVVVILSNMVAGLTYAVTGKTDNIPAVLSSSLFLVIGFYFSRTNHAAIGGIGRKPDDEQVYKGR